MAVAKQTEEPPDNSGGNDNGSGPWVIEASADDLLDSPLDFIFAEHLRQRDAAGIFLRLADGEFHHRGVKALIHFMENDFALHIGDEELALFPILKEHCLPEDNVERVINRLKEEHREDETNGDLVISILKSMDGVNRLSAVQKSCLRNFAEHIRQHLALENGILLPIARQRLAQTELAMLAEMLKERRR